MSFDNYYPNRKDHRKPFGLPKRIDRTCRNGGKCSRCRSSRMYSTNKWKMAALDQLLDEREDEIQPEPGTETTAPDQLVP